MSSPIRPTGALFQQDAMRGICRNGISQVVVVRVFIPAGVPARRFVRRTLPGVLVSVGPGPIASTATFSGKCSLSRNR